MRITVSPFLIVCSAAMAAPLVQPTETLIDNDQVKVVRALEQPHVKGKFHEHKLNRVMIYLQSGRQRFGYQDGRKPDVFDFTAGEVKWSPSEGMHSPEVVSGTPFNIIEVELKKPGAGKPIEASLDPLKIDPKHYHLEFENDQVRVLRVKIGAHETAPTHQHSLNRVTVFLTGQDFRVTAGGKVDSVQHRAGDVAWGTPLTHQEENASDQPFEALVVEIKDPA